MYLSLRKTDVCWSQAACNLEFEQLLVFVFNPDDMLAFELCGQRK